MNAKQIAEGNDELRTNILNPLYYLKNRGKNQVILSREISVLPETQKSNILNAVVKFNDFNENNDPYKEHDFGAIEIEFEEKVFFKLDYYDKNFEYGVDPYKEMPYRVLTIMFASEY